MFKLSILIKTYLRKIQHTLFLSTYELLKFYVFNKKIYNFLKMLKEIKLTLALMLSYFQKKMSNLKSNC